MVQFVMFLVAFEVLGCCDILMRSSAYERMFTMWMREGQVKVMLEKTEEGLRKNSFLEDTTVEQESFSCKRHLWMVPA